MIARTGANRASVAVAAPALVVGAAALLPVGYLVLRALDGDVADVVTDRRTLVLIWRTALLTGAVRQIRSSVRLSLIHI